MIRILPIYGHAAKSQGIIILKREVLFSSVHKTSSIIQKTCVCQQGADHFYRCARHASRSAHPPAGHRVPRHVAYRSGGWDRAALPAYATHIAASGEAFDAAEYDLLRQVFAQYRQTIC